VADSQAQGVPTNITIHYDKVASYREVACDGALGGPTPQQKLWLAFYTERFPLPRIVEQSLQKAPLPDTFQIDETIPANVLDSKTGIIRNVEFGVYLSLDSAERLYTWLGAQIENLKTLK
jgi:hypothetical protein